MTTPLAVGIKLTDANTGHSRSKCSQSCGPWPQSHCVLTEKASNAETTWHYLGDNIRIWRYKHDLGPYYEGFREKLLTYHLQHHWIDLLHISVLLPCSQSHSKVRNCTTDQIFQCSPEQNQTWKNARGRANFSAKVVIISLANQEACYKKSANQQRCL